MADRETKELKTAGGHVVVYCSKIKGREFLDIARKDRTGNETAQGIDKAIDMMEKVIVSVDGTSDNMIDRIQDFDLEDYIEVTTAVAALTGNFQKAK